LCNAHTAASLFFHLYIYSVVLPWNPPRALYIFIGTKPHREDVTNVPYTYRYTLSCPMGIYIYGSPKFFGLLLYYCFRYYFRGLNTLFSPYPFLSHSYGSPAVASTAIRTCNVGFLSYTHTHMYWQKYVTCISTLCKCIIFCT